MDEGGWFDWDEANEDHVMKHGVDPAEVEEALLDPGGARLDVYKTIGERRFGLVGAAGAGRILAVVYTFRRGKTRPITARDATNTEKRRYRRR